MMPGLSLTMCQEAESWAPMDDPPAWAQALAEAQPFTSNACPVSQSLGLAHEPCGLFVGPHESQPIPSHWAQAPAHTWALIRTSHTTLLPWQPDPSTHSPLSLGALSSSQNGLQARITSLSSSLAGVAQRLVSQSPPTPLPLTPTPPPSQQAQANS